MLLLWKLASSCHNNLSKVSPVIEKLVQKQLNWNDKQELKSLLTCVCYAFKKSTPESTYIYSYVH